MNPSSARPPSSFEEACALADAEEARRSEPDEVARLAKLSKLEYDRQRDDAAMRLEVGEVVGTTRNYDWPGRPDGVWLHSQCETPWFNSECCAAGRAS
jgi:hypothetical protein